MAVMELDKAIHPGVEKLSKLAQGRLTADDVAALEEHMAGCEDCCRLLEETPDDSFVARLRQAWYLPAVDTLFNAGALTLSGEGEEPGELANHPRYRLMRLLGRGGMGAVYLAEHRHMARPVALKVINPELLNQRGALPRFQQEARTAAKLDHPNIVAAYDADQSGSLHFLVMEYIEGQNLADYLSEKRSIPVNQACDIIRQAAQGLQHAHEQGMVHRDIKPHNLMLTPSGQVKVLDFGLARLAAEPTSTWAEGEASPQPHLTGAGAVMGSADYIAPEQARDARAADCRSDIYSLGCTLYYLLTNQPPFPEGTAPEKLQRHGVDDPCLLTALRPDVPKELAHVVSKMMAKRPEHRYQSAADVAAALNPYALTTAPKRFGIRVRALAIAMSALVMLSLAAAGVVRLQSGDREIIIETDDPTVEIVVKGDRIVRIVDPKTGKAYQLDRNDLTLTLADDPDGLAIVLDGERPLNLKRQGNRIATVRVVGSARALKEPEPALMTGQPKLPTEAPAVIEPPSPLFAMPPPPRQPAPNPASQRTEPSSQVGVAVGPVPSIQLEVAIASVSPAEARRLASRWIEATNGDDKQPSKPRNGARPVFGMARDRDGMLKDLSALREKNLAKLMTQPRVITQSGRPAWIVSGGQAPILTSSSAGVPSVDYKAIGTIINLLPTILPNGRIQLDFRPEITDLDASMGFNVDGPQAISVPGFRTQSMQTTVQMESGKTLIMGGLIDKRSKEEERELIFLVTPRVISPAVEQQVQLDVSVTRVNRAEGRRLTSRWKEQPNCKFDTIDDGDRLRSDLLALREKGLAKLVAQPRVITLSGRPAWIVDGGKTPIITTSDTGAPKVDYETFGTIVNVLPVVMHNGKIHLEVRPEISALNAALGITLPGTVTANVPGFDLRSAQVAAEIEDGQTLAIGGLIQSSVNAQKSKVPILGDIPLIGVFFNSTTHVATEEEFIILVTPHVIGWPDAVGKILPLSAQSAQR